MPIQKKWTSQSKTPLMELPKYFSVYEIANKKKEIIYIGEGRLKPRLTQHFSKFSEAYYFRFELTGSKKRCQQRERVLHRAFLTKNGRLPLYNSHLGEVI